MLNATPAHVLIWLIAAAVICGMLLRPWNVCEALWASGGAALLVLGALISWSQALRAIGRGTDVYLFLAGMMLLAELARSEGLFDWVAAHAVRTAAGSPRRLFGLIYLVGIVVTALLSNDATAVVLTPAVYAAARQARTEALPYLLICAFIANAASFLLPIANPANLVVYASHLPPLGAWLAVFLLPSAAAIAVTFLVLRATQRAALQGEFIREVSVVPLRRAGRLTAAGIGLTVLVLLWASASGRELGAPTLAAAALILASVIVFERRNPWPLLKEVSWSVLPLVAGLFVLVAALGRTGVLAALGTLLAHLARSAGGLAGFIAGAAVALAGNAMNNLPVALIAATLGAGHRLGAERPSMLIGVDLGPNLSVSGSLATILWLIALRREKVPMNAMRFLKLGVWVMPPALLAALLALALGHAL